MVSVTKFLKGKYSLHLNKNTRLFVHGLCLREWSAKQSTESPPPRKGGPASLQRGEKGKKLSHTKMNHAYTCQELFQNFSAYIKLAHICIHF